MHTEHCCVVHGCKYGDGDCAVVHGNKPQSYPCESCHDTVSTYQEVLWEYECMLKKLPDHVVGNLS